MSQTHCIRCGGSLEGRVSERENSSGAWLHKYWSDCIACLVSEVLMLRAKIEDYEDRLAIEPEFIG